VDHRHRHVKLVRALVLELEIVALNALNRQSPKSEITPDAVIEMDDVIPDLQVAEGRDEFV
jgi:hypothetical protein